jgi:hypothetical protein
VSASEDPLFARKRADAAIRRAGDVLVAKKSRIRHIVGTVLRYPGMASAGWRAPPRGGAEIRPRQSGPATTGADA